MAFYVDSKECAGFYYLNEKTLFFNIWRPEFYRTNHNVSAIRLSRRDWL